MGADIIIRPCTVSFLNRDDRPLEMSIAALLSSGVKAALPHGWRGLLAETLVSLYPGAVSELMRRRRLSFWCKTSRSPHQQTVWAYADRHSISPGQTFRLMMSAGPGRSSVAGQLEIFRIGCYEASDRCLIWTSRRLRISEYGVTNTAAALGPAWPCAIEVNDTARWQTGYHSVDFVEPDGTRHADIAFIVITAREPETDILVKLATATYQAYNRWGGHNLYMYETPGTLNGERPEAFETDPPSNRGHIVTFDRPTTSEFWEWEYYFVLWIESLAREEGFTVAYATNFDLAREPALTSNCKLLVSVGHDEYWSKEEFDLTHDRIFLQGGNTLFLGSNTAYWQVRYADVNAPQGNSGHPEGRQMICYKSLEDPVRYRIEINPDLHVTARFREDARRPETMLMGIGLQSNFAFRRQETRADYYVVDTDFPFFKGTGYRPGAYVGNLIGHEWDNRDPEAEYPCPGEPRVEAHERLWRAGRSHIARIPADRIRTVFSGETTDLAGRRGRAEAVYFKSPAGARVFSSGTNRWTWGLGKHGYTQERFRRFNRNLVLHFLKRGKGGH